MVSAEEKIKQIEEEISSTPYNKASQHHIGKLKAKLAQLREKTENAKKGGGGYGFGLKKEGDATAVLVGFPSVGKSTLLNKLTNAESRVAAYEFTTLDVIPGMMEHQKVKVQILDLPGVISGASIGKGRGREALSIVRNADLVLIMVDVMSPGRFYDIEKELYNVGVRMNQNPPKIRIEKTSKGGILVTSTIKNNLEKATVSAILSAYGIHNANVTMYENVDEDTLIDHMMGNRVYVPSLTIVNKIDRAPEEQAHAIAAKLPDCVLISADSNRNLEVLKDRIIEKLSFIRVYMRPQGGEPDYKEPLIIREGATINDLCEKLHTSFRKKLRYALIWGLSVKHDGQRKGPTHRLRDGDVVTLILKR
ncbi:MAG: GTP-binding protein [Candidatus Altiarchaeota archaeon]